jgi:hypothetical protein
MKILFLMYFYTNKANLINIAPKKKYEGTESYSTRGVLEMFATEACSIIGLSA